MKKLLEFLLKLVLLIVLLQVALVLYVRKKKKDYLAQEVGEDEINIVAVTDGVEEKVEIPDFKGGYVRAIMGGIELDLSEVSLETKPATLEATVAMGGVEIKVPRGWQVAVDVAAFMGGADNACKVEDRTDECPPDLMITGKVIMGGLSVQCQ